VAVKTHKSKAVARLQLAAGAAGPTAATITEAEAMADVGTADLLVAYPPVGSWRLDRRLGTEPGPATAAKVAALALTVLSTVLSRPSPDRVIFDAGSKALSRDQLHGTAGGYGALLTSLRAACTSVNRRTHTRWPASFDSAAATGGPVSQMMTPGSRTRRQADLRTGPPRQGHCPDQRRTKPEARTCS
jgi:D-serine deaminase-like pyridoxal phosphate-dependent protein